MFRYCVQSIAVLIALSYGCGPLETQESTIEQSVVQPQGTGEGTEPTTGLRRPTIQTNSARFYHESQRSRVAIRYRNVGSSQAYRVRTELAVFLEGNSVPIEADTSVVPALAPNRGLESRGLLPDAFYEGVTDGKETFVMEFTVRYQNEQGKEFEAFSVWQFSRSTMEFFLLEEKAT